MLTGKALIRIFVSFFPFPSAPLMIAAEKLPLVVFDYRRSTSNDIHIKLFRVRVDSTGERHKMPRRAFSSLTTGKILQTNPTTSPFSNITLVDKKIFIHNQTQHTQFVAYDKVRLPTLFATSRNTRKILIPNGIDMPKL